MPFSNITYKGNKINTWILTCLMCGLRNTIENTNQHPRKSEIYICSYSLFYESCEVSHQISEQTANAISILYLKFLYTKEIGQSYV